MPQRASANMQRERASWARRSRRSDIFVVEALFTTVTNVNFDAARIEAMIRKAATVKKNAQALYEDACAAPATRAGKA